MNIHTRRARETGHRPIGWLDDRAPRQSPRSAVGIVLAAAACSLRGARGATANSWRGRRRRSPLFCVRRASHVEVTLLPVDAEAGGSALQIVACCVRSVAAAQAHLEHARRGGGCMQVEAARPRRTWTISWHHDAQHISESNADRGLKPATAGRRSGGGGNLQNGRCRRGRRRRFERESAYAQSVSRGGNVVISAPVKEWSRQSSASAPGTASTADPLGWVPEATARR